MITRPSKSQRVVAGLATAAAVCAGVVTIAVGSASATTSTTVSITGVSPHLVPAGTASQVITITGKGFSQATMASVVLSGAGACATDPNFIVTSPTSMVLKTVGTDCTAGAATITITDSSGTATNPVAAATNLTFVAPPTLKTVDVSHNAVVTDNTSGLAYADQAVTVPVGGGSIIRVYAGSTPFVTSTSTPLAATLGGVALTGIVMHASGDYFTGKVGPHAAGAVPLTVTSGGVSSTFSGSADNGFSYAGSTIAVTPAFGPANGGNTITIAGAGFTSGSTVKVGGVSATSVVVTGSTKITCTVPMAAANTNSGPVTVVVTTGSATSDFSAGSVYSYLS